MYGYIYITINLINGKKYIGQKKSTYFQENYKGSGRALKQAFSKYGFDNFKVELIEECNSQEELNNRERYWIKKHNAVESRDYYNLCNGGGTVDGMKHSEETRKKMSDAHSKRSYVMSDYQKQRISETHPSMKGENNPMYGKHHSKETRAIISQKRSERQSGTKWVNNGTKECYAKGEHLINLLNDGYSYGRLYRPRNKKSSTTIES